MSCLLSSIWYFGWFYNMSTCDNTPLADPHYLNQPNYSWPLELSNGFSHLWPGVFHISLPTHKIQLRGWKKRRTKSQAWVSSWHSVLLWANAGMYLSETPTKPQRNADLSSHVGQPRICRSTGFSSHLSDFCWLVSSLPCSHLLTDLFLTALSCLLSFSADCVLLSSLGPFFPRPLLVSWEILCASPLCGFCAKTDKGILWLAPTPTEMNPTYHIMNHCWVIFCQSQFNSYGLR